MRYLVELPAARTPPAALLAVGTLVVSGPRRQLLFRDRFNALKAARHLGGSFALHEVVR